MGSANRHWAIVAALGLACFGFKAHSAPVEFDWAYAWVHMGGVAWAGGDDIDIPDQYVDPPGFSRSNNGVFIEALGDWSSSEQQTSNTYRYSSTVTLSAFASIDADVPPDGDYGTPFAQAYSALEWFMFSFKVLAPVRYAGNMPLQTLEPGGSFGGESYSAGDILVPGFYGLEGYGPYIWATVNTPGTSEFASHEMTWNFVFVDAPPTPILLLLGAAIMLVLRRFRLNASLSG